VPGPSAQVGDDERLAPVCPACGAALPDLASIQGGDRLLGSPGLFEVRVCGVCGAGRTGPPLSEGELAEFYREGYASHEEGAPRLLAGVTRRLKRLQVRAILRRPPFSTVISGPPGRALDVGCGRGDLAGALLARGWRVAGIEPSGRAAAIAAGRGVEMAGATLATAQLAPGEYDLVIFRHSLEHLPEPLEDLRRVREALRPGGRVVISAPNFGSWQRRRFAANWFHLDLPRHRVHFTPASLAVALRRADLAVDAQFTSTSALGLPASLQYVLVRRCLAPGGLRLRLLAALCCAAFPATWLIDRSGGERDTLHLLARRA
jgi:SAM-dependent methyltransferase